MKSYISLLGIGSLILLGCGTTEESRYQRDHNRQIVTDTHIKLQWQDDEAAASDDVVLKWEEAVAHCEALNLGGFSDWGLPDKEALYTLSDIKVDGKRKVDPAIDSTFKHIQSAMYWTSTTVPRSGDTSAFYINTVYGGEYRASKSKQLFVRCVREGK